MGPAKVDDEVQEIRVEQQYFDEAMDFHLQKVEGFEQTLKARGTAHEKQAMKKSFENFQKLGPDDAAAIMRIDTEDGDSLYLGKTAILNDDKDILVINWKQPAAAKFYQATPEDPQGVVRKREFKTDQNRIKSFRDQHLAQLAQEIAELDGYLQPSDALLDSLTSARTGEMQDIVGTIQAAQDKILRTKMDSLLVVQGGPGTGKTAVALHRASWLLYNHPEVLPPDELLVVGPNPAFTKYISKVLPDLGDYDVPHTSVEEMLQRSIPVRAVEPANIAQIKGSHAMQNVIAEGLNDRIRTPTSPIRIRRRNSLSTITLLAEDVAEDITKLRHQYYGAGREALKARLLQRCAAALGARAGADVENIVDPRSLDAELNRMWPQLSAAQFVRELLGSKQRLRKAASNLDHEAIELLYRQPAERMSDEPWTLADLALIDEAAASMQDRQERWRHIIVDEAQDLTPMQLVALRRRSRGGSMTIVGDLAQSTGPFARDTWADIIDDLRTSVEVIEEELAFGYRVPREVYEVAQRLLPLAAPGTTPPKIVRTANALPELFDVSPALVPREVARIASHHSSKGRFVGVIAPPEYWDDITAAFSAEEVQWSDSRTGGLGQSINLVTPEASKGLEFDAVTVVAPQTILDEDHGGRLLYIALTRTTNRLDVVVPSGEVPEILRDAFPSITVIDEPMAEESDSEESDTDGDQDRATVGDPANTDDASESVTNISDAEQDRLPTPKDIMGNMGRLSKVGDLISVGSFQETVEPQEPAMSALQQELVTRNAQYLAEILWDSYGPAMRAPILREALAVILERLRTEGTR